MTLFYVKKQCIFASRIKGCTQSYGYNRFTKPGRAVFGRLKVGFKLEYFLGIKSDNLQDFGYKMLFESYFSDIVLGTKVKNTPKRYDFEI